jgi:hypothetical protein
MRAQTTALGVALGLLTVPQRVRAARSEPLPAGILALLQIAGGDDAVLADAAKRSGRDPAVLRRAAAFYIEQVLLSRESDAYRVLGATPDASAADLRRNMALLLRWLHPDIDRKGERSIFAGRVTAAWEELKTPERRAAYDLKRLQAKAAKRPRSRSNGGGPPGPLRGAIRRPPFDGARLPALLGALRLPTLQIARRLRTALSRLLRRY